MEILQNRMRELQFALYERKIPLVLVFEGMDAAGKGGNIKRIRETRSNRISSSWYKCTD